MEQVESVIVNAKLNLGDLQLTTQTVHFASDLDDGNIKLLELDPSLLDFLEMGRRYLYF